MVKLLSLWRSSWPQLPSGYSFHDVLAACPLEGAGSQDLKVTKYTHPAVTAAWRLHSSHASSGSPPPLEKLTCVMTMQCPRSTSSLKVLRWRSCPCTSVPTEHLPFHVHMVLRCRGRREELGPHRQQITQSGFQPHRLFLASASSFSEIWNASQLIFPG